jgi:hypothetical protein
MTHTKLIRSFTIFTDVYTKEKYDERLFLTEKETPTIDRQYTRLHLTSIILIISA